MAPLSIGMAEDMFGALGGIFNEKSDARKQMADALTRFSRMLVENPRLEEIDLNPVRLLPKQGEFKVLDIRVRLQDS